MWTLLDARAGGWQGNQPAALRKVSAKRDERMTRSKDLRPKVGDVIAARALPPGGVAIDARRR